MQFLHKSSQFWGNVTRLQALGVPLHCGFTPSHPDFFPEGALCYLVAGTPWGGGGRFWAPMPADQPNFPLKKNILGPQLQVCSTTHPKKPTLPGGPSYSRHEAYALQQVHRTSFLWVQAGNERLPGATPDEKADPGTLLFLHLEMRPQTPPNPTKVARFHCVSRVSQDPKKIQKYDRVEKS